MDADITVILNKIAEETREISALFAEIHGPARLPESGLRDLFIPLRNVAMKARAHKLYLKILRARLAELGAPLGNLHLAGQTVDQVEASFDPHRVASLAAEFAPCMLMF